MLAHVNDATLKNLCRHALISTICPVFPSKSNDKLSYADRRPPLTLLIDDKTEENTDEYLHVQFDAGEIIIIAVADNIREVDVRDTCR